MIKALSQYIAIASTCAEPVSSYRKPKEKPCKICGEMTAYTVKKSDYGRSYICQECADKDSK